MSIEKPDYHDADLVLRVYEMRREAKTRESRDLLNFKFWPKSYDDVKAVQQPDNPMNAAWRQMSAYWEMVYGLARNGIVNPDYWMENNGEGLFLFAKIAPYIAKIRETGSPIAFQNAEWVSTQTETGRRIFDRIQTVVKQMSESK